ncbi:MAG: HyaD/HybD family hydrogenase maturation endopeptidase [Gemmatimonadaceae bacterium]|nr:HyaD/HybD family hydrogenase maturation endopeptidase [Gemmatimonadaceae bacterium]
MRKTDGEAVATTAAVIGLGNPLLGDDALGLVALERLQNHYTMPDEVSLHDGGTWGMSLLPTIEDATNVLFLDAIDRNEVPGTFIRLEGTEIPATLAQMVSPHQIDLREVLAVTMLRGTFPHSAVAVGVQPETLATQVALSRIVASKVDEVVEAAVAQLRVWGHVCVPREPDEAGRMRPAAANGGISGVVCTS